MLGDVKYEQEMKLTASILVDKLSLFLAFLKVLCEHVFTAKIHSAQ